jgi:hypothetical protein
VIEQATGKPYEAFRREAILARPGITGHCCIATGA